jgi:hypothetical protein
MQSLLSEQIIGCEAATSWWCNRLIYGTIHLHPHGCARLQGMARVYGFVLAVAMALGLAQGFVIPGAAPRASRCAAGPLQAVREVKSAEEFDSVSGMGLNAAAASVCVARLCHIGNRASRVR